MVAPLDNSASPAPAPALTDQQRRLVDFMRKMGAVDASHAKTADDIIKVGKFAKGQALAWLQELEKKGVIRRAPASKAAHYYLK